VGAITPFHRLSNALNDSMLMPSSFGWINASTAARLAADLPQRGGGDAATTHAATVTFDKHMKRTRRAKYFWSRWIKWCHGANSAPSHRPCSGTGISGRME
jgi:hypothetical protein